MNIEIRIDAKNGPFSKDYEFIGRIFETEFNARGLRNKLEPLIDKFISKVEVNK